jgi:uncharacterized protein (TIGR02246 family)
MPDSPDQLHRAFQDAFNCHDLESIVALYEPEAVLVTADGTVEGQEAIRKRYRDALLSRPSIDVRTLSVNIAGDLVLLHGRWLLRETGPDGSEVRREGWNTEMARRQPDGRWLFVIDNPAVPRD